MFSEAALANLIRFYGHAMQGFMGTYLEKNVQAFTDIQAQAGRAVQDADARDVDPVHEPCRTR